MFSAFVAREEAGAFVFNFSHEYWNTPHLLEGSITCCKMQQKSLLLKALIQHYSSPIRGVARCGPTHAGPSLGDPLWQHGPVPPGLFRKAAPGRGKGLCVEVRMTLKLSLMI